jgi:hypothetical protein
MRRRFDHVVVVESDPTKLKEWLNRLSREGYELVSMCALGNEVWAAMRLEVLVPEKGHGFPEPPPVVQTAGGPRCLCNCHAQGKDICEECKPFHAAKGGLRP